MSESFDVVVGSKRQVTFPAELFRRLALKEGDHLRFTVEGDVIHIEPMVSVPRRLVSASLLEEMNARRGVSAGDISLAEFVAERRKTAETTAQALPPKGHVVARGRWGGGLVFSNPEQSELDQEEQRYLTAE